MDEPQDWETVSELINPIYLLPSFWSLEELKKLHKSGENEVETTSVGQRHLWADSTKHSYKQLWSCYISSKSKTEETLMGWNRFQISYPQLQAQPNLNELAYSTDRSLNSLDF